MNSNSIWQLKENADLELAATLADNLNISLPTAKLLLQRGISGIDEAKKFLYGNRNDLSLPEELGGIETAVARIKKAITNHEKIVVFGDYDVDGITSVVLMMECLACMDADADYYIPNRFDEGYGLNETAVRELADKGCQLLITVDCGIVSFKEVELAMSMGVDVIITDHHTPSAQVPPAVAVINPKLEGNRNNFDLAGVGVAFKLAQALIGNPDEAYRWLDLVALATVADVVPLQGDNRILVKEGLECIRRSFRPGLQALLSESGLENRPVLNSWHIAFILAPRLNSAGRLDQAQIAVDLLLCQDNEKASEIAKYLCNMNNKRKNIEEMIFKEALLKINNEKDLQRDRVLVLAGEGWHQGVIGIVASRIAEKYHRPTIIISWEGETGKGSGRSQAGFDLFQALEGCRDYLLQYGGHKMAAGLTIKRNDYELFQDSINQIAALTLDDKALLPVRQIDVQLQPEDISDQFYDELCLFEPYGEGNPAPVFLLRNVEIKNHKLVGKNEEHLKFKIEPGGMDCIAFGHPEWAASGLCSCYQDIAFVIDRNEFQGKTNLQLQIKDLRPSFKMLGRASTAVPDRRIDIIKKTLAELNNNRPVIYLYPTYRSLKMHQMFVKSTFTPGRIIELHGRVPQSSRIGQQHALARGECGIYLITMAYYKYFIQKHALPDSLHYSVSLVKQDDKSEVWLDKEKDFDLLLPIVDWSYQEQKTVIYSNRRQTMKMLSDSIKNIMIETGKSARERVDLREIFSNSEAGAFIIDGLFPSIQSSFKNIDELVFADLPFSFYEACLIREQIAADDLKHIVLFTREHLAGNKYYLFRQYPDKEVIKKVLVFLCRLNKNPVTDGISELCMQIGEYIGKAFSTVDLFPVLQILSDLGLCECRKKGSMIEIKCFKSQSLIADVTRSPYYLEGLAEKNAFTRWEHQLSRLWNGNDGTTSYNK